MPRVRDFNDVRLEWQKGANAVATPSCATWLLFFFSSRRRHTRSDRDWSSDVCSSDLRASPAGWRCWTELLRLEPLDEADQRHNRPPEVARARVFHRVVADAAAAAHEQHADRKSVV